MIRLGCLLARGDHAATCPRCRADAAHDRAVRAIVETASPPGVSPRARDAAFARAFAEPAVMPVRRWTARLVPAGFALAAVAAIAVVVVIATRGGGGGSAPTAPVNRAIAAGATTAVGHGRVALSADGVAWQTGPTEVYLLTGRVDVEVDPAPHQAFRVKTNDFVVDVLGTVFAVSADGVEVSRGAVRVSSPAGAVLVDRLAAGQRWAAHDKTATAPTPDPTDDANEPDEIVMDPESAGSASPRPDPDKLVDAARTQLANKDIAGARKTIAQALAAKPTRAVRIKAELVLADSYKNAGDPDEAIARYRAIAERYHDHGEALVEAAQLEAKRGHAPAAGELYRLYLDRYPDGALADIARRALRTK